MYLADATGYLGYVGIMLARDSLAVGSDFLEFFRALAWIASALAALGLCGAWWCFLGRRPADEPAPRPGFSASGP